MAPPEIFFVPLILIFERNTIFERSLTAKRRRLKQL